MIVNLSVEVVRVIREDAHIVLVELGMPANQHESLYT